MNNRQIILKNVQVHNLKKVSLALDPGKLILFTGVSGSGKSSLAFDTLYMEGQRRYIESLSTFARRQLGEMAKPELESATGITPTISIEQKTAGRNPRSTVGTMTEIYDYLRVLFARVAIPYCPISLEPVTPQSRERIIKTIQSSFKDHRVLFLAPLAKQKKGEFREEFQELLRKGFTRIRIDGNFKELSDEISLDGQIAHDVDVIIDRIIVQEENFSRIAEAVTLALQFSNGVMSILDVESKEETLFSMHAFSKGSGLSYTSLEPNDFSFNSPSGMCPECNGMGKTLGFDLSKVIDESLSVSSDFCKIASSYQTVRYGNIYDNLARIYHFNVETPWKDLSEKAKKVLLWGTEKKWTRMFFIHPDTGATWTDHIQWRGMLHEAKARYLEAKSERYRKKMQEVMKEEVCPSCQGCRLKPYPAAARFLGKKIYEITQQTVGFALDFFQTAQLEASDALIANELLKEIQERLKFLKEVGLEYLSLDRAAPTLSGGEAQRVRLASQIGSGLVGITYILDEPTIGLHPRDNRRLIKTLKLLRDSGNTVIVVDHDEEMIRTADRIIDFGPGASSKGGEIVYDGTLQGLLQCPQSLTGAYLSGKKSIAVPKKRRKGSKEKITIKGASHHNLKEVDVSFPLGLLIAITGVSGSGKSSLITDTLYPALANHLHFAKLDVGPHKKIEGLSFIDKVIAIDQSPIGRNPRSNPATYIKLFDEIRDLFCKLPESLARGYKPGRFSFNVKEGSCETCGGMGQTKVDLDFLEDAWVTCTSCQGKRFDEETLSVYYKGKNIQDVLEMDVETAASFFSAIPKIFKKLKTLQEVGLGYLPIGQASTTLSGGEAQRVKLAKELSRPSTGKTFYILDEPTTGLHFEDIHHLLQVLQKIVEKGNTVVVIEHNMDVVKTADWIIDIGPEGGLAGGEIVGAGTPEKIAKLPTPTGAALTEILYHPHANQEAILEHTVSHANSISIIGAEQNNLKQVDLTIPREKITILTGPSGSGKSSLAFDTLYAEGQRRYIESMSPYARQFVKQMPKPKVAQIEGLSPAIAIEQKIHAGNPRSTVGTMTEAYDYLRVLYSVIGQPHCPETKEPIQAISKELVVQKILSFKEGGKVQILAPLPLKKTETLQETLIKWQKKGYLRVRLNGEYFEVDQEIPFDRKQKNALFLVIDRLKIQPSSANRLRDAIAQAAQIGEEQLVADVEGEDLFFNLSFSVASTGKSYPKISPHTFSFNAEEGMCLDCLGLGVQYGANFAGSEASLQASPLLIFRHLFAHHLTSKVKDVLQQCFQKNKIDLNKSISALNPKQLQAFLNGQEEDKWIELPGNLRLRWSGIDQTLVKAGKHANSEIKEQLLPWLKEVVCPSCLGTRINPLARNVTIQGISIADLCSFPIDKALSFLKNISIPPKEAKILEEISSQLISRLAFLNEVGLHYLSLNRKAPTLSGGEAQRIRLARQLGSGLTGVLYVLDEPTIGLHPKDISKLNQSLHKLKNLGNTLVLVEHDPLTIKEADLIVDFGPKSGEAGGHITAKGTYKEICLSPDSLTGAYLSGRRKVCPERSKRKRPSEKNYLSVKKACANNLKNISLDFPLHALTCLTGVSGSGKSTLLEDILLPALKEGLNRQNQISLPTGIVSGILAFDKLCSIDQNPIGHTARSDVGTYVDFLSRLREFFASLPLAKVKGLQGKHFSYNHRRGMCTHCWGMGYRKVEMFFLPSVRVVCEECKGLRLNPVSLEVTYLGKNFGQYLDLTANELRKLLENHPRMTRILDTLISVGLGYLKIGQEVATLSGGEAQRIKLSKELAKRQSGKTLYLLDEPTTGLHADDVQKLMTVLYKLVDKGNTMIVIEHNEDVIACADCVYELGPEAGDKGGEIVFFSPLA